MGSAKRIRKISQIEQGLIYVLVRGIPLKT
jgi:hypothetical protein